MSADPGPDELRALVREVLREVLPAALSVTETVNLSTDEDLAAFVMRLLDLESEQREELRSGRKRFRLATVPSAPPAPTAAPAPAPGAPAPGATAPVPATDPAPVRRIERGAVTEKVVSQAARAGQRLVLGRAAVLTPLARDRARASGVVIEKER